MPIQNSKILQYKFLNEMYEDAYYPPHLVDEIKNILVDLCEKIESNQPENLDGLYLLTHAATEKINDLKDAFEEADSEIETVARGAMGTDFYFIAKAYEYYDADHEELISSRDW